MFCFCFCFLLFRAVPVAYGGSQARGPVGAAAARLHHSHSIAGSELHLRCAPQPTATLDPWPTEQGQGSNPHPHGCWSDSFLLCHNGNTENIYSWEWDEWEKKDGNAALWAVGLARGGLSLARSSPHLKSPLFSAAPTTSPTPVCTLKHRCAFVEEVTYNQGRFQCRCSLKTQLWGK